jgi:hypothetical protein
MGFMRRAQVCIALGYVSYIPYFSRSFAKGLGQPKTVLCTLTRETWERMMIRITARGGSAAYWVCLTTGTIFRQDGSCCSSDVLRLA